MTGHRPPRVPNRFTALVVAISLAAIAFAACGGASPSPSTGKMVVSGAWARASMSMDRAVAVYLSVKNDSGADDALVGVSSPAGKAELHDTMAGDSGMIGMQAVAKVAIAKGATLELKAGGYHIMLVELTSMLQAGSSVELTLSFEHAPAVKVSAEVRAN